MNSSCRCDLVVVILNDCERGEVSVCCWRGLTHGVVIFYGYRVETGVGGCCCRSGVAESIGDEGTDW